MERPMGIFDVFTNAFTGAPAKEAAERSRALLQQTQNDVTARTGAAKSEAERNLLSGYQMARDKLARGYGAATGAVRAGTGEALGYLDQGTAGALSQLGQARGDLT